MMMMMMMMRGKGGDNDGEDDRPKTPCYVRSNKKEKERQGKKEERLSNDKLNG
jgi:hypothetical protein